jgi:hypothetical protein
MYSVYLLKIYHTDVVFAENNELMELDQVVMMMMLEV